jgi:hypothetical protein
MAFDAHKNMAVSTVATAPSPATSGTSLVVAAGEGARFPATPFNATVGPAQTVLTPANSEIVRVTAISTDTLTITRAQESSSARSILVGDQIAATITAKTITDIEAIARTDGWIDDTAETWTYASFTAGPPASGTFTVPGDQTAKYTIGTRIQLTQSSTVKYFVVTGSSYSSPNTTVTITGGTDYTLANSAITANYHSYEENPQGYPGWFSFDAAITGFGGTPSKATAFSVSGRVCTLSFWVNGTSNSTSLDFTAPITSINTIGFIFQATDSGTIQTVAGYGQIDFNSTSGHCYKALDQSGWTSSGTKQVQTFNLPYRI